MVICIIIVIVVAVAIVVAIDDDIVICFAIVIVVVVVVVLSSFWLLAVLTYSVFFRTRWKLVSLWGVSFGCPLGLRESPTLHRVGAGRCM